MNNAVIVSRIAYLAFRITQPGISRARRWVHPLRDVLTGLPDLFRLRTEIDSPRGRIALMRAAAESVLHLPRVLDQSYCAMGERRCL